MSAHKGYVESTTLEMRKPVGDNYFILDETCPIDGAELVESYGSGSETRSSISCNICGASYSDISEQGLEQGARDHLGILKTELIYAKIRLGRVQERRSKLVKIINVAEENLPSLAN